MKLLRKLLIFATLSALLVCAVHAQKATIEAVEPLLGQELPARRLGVSRFTKLASIHRATVGQLSFVNFLAGAGPDGGVLAHWKNTGSTRSALPGRLIVWAHLAGMRWMAVQKCHPFSKRSPSTPCITALVSPAGGVVS